MTQDTSHKWTVIINAVLTAICSIIAGLTTASCVSHL